MQDVKYGKKDRLQDAQYIIFLLGSTRFGIPILQALRISHVLPITRVPGAPPFLEGVVNDQSQVVPLVDLRKRLGLAEIQPQSTPNDRERILMVEVDNQVIGMLVTSVVGISRIPAAAIQPPPPMVAQVNGVFLTGVVQSDTQLTMILNLTHVLTVDEISDVDEWHAGVTVE